MNFNHVALFHRALSDPIRLKIVLYLLENDNIGLAKFATLINRDKMCTYRHLDILTKAGLITSKREYGRLFFNIKDKVKVLRMFEI